MDSVGGIQAQYGTNGLQAGTTADTTNAFAMLFAQMMSQQMDRALFSGMGSSDENSGSAFSESSLFSMLLQMAGSGSANISQGNNFSAANAAYGLGSNYGIGSNYGLGGNSSVAGLTGRGAAEAALTRLGDPYSQAKRGTGDYVDCSSLTQWAYQKTGVSLPGTAAEQAKYCVQNGYTIEKQDLQPGDLVFWQKAGCNCGRYDEIHHVGVYLGDGKVVEASSSKGQVVVNDLWGESGGKWQTAFYARPY